MNTDSFIAYINPYRIAGNVEIRFDAKYEKFQIMNYIKHYIKEKEKKEFD